MLLLLLHACASYACCLGAITRVCACVCVCVCVCARVCKGESVCVRAHVHVCLCAWLSVCACACVRMRVCMSVCAGVCARRVPAHKCCCMRACLHPGQLD
jgi:hypothetical protein